MTKRLSNEVYPHDDCHHPELLLVVRYLSLLVMMLETVYENVLKCRRASRSEY